MSQPIRGSNSKATKDCQCLFTTPGAVGCDRCLFEGRPCTWTVNKELYETRLRNFVGVFPIWSLVTKEPVRRIEAPKFARLNDADEVIDAAIDAADLEEEGGEAEEEGDSD